MRTNDMFLLRCEERRREWRQHFNQRIHHEQPNRTSRVPVSVAAVRSWRPEDKAPDAAMNAVLELLIDHGRALQSDLASELANILDVKLGTARAYVSASLLMFREAGWVQCVTKPGDKKPVWEINE